MKKGPFLAVVTLLLLTSTFAVAQPAFVKTSGHQFTLNGKPYYYIGANYWYGSLLALQKNDERGKDRVRRELDFLQRKGVSNLRVLAGAEGSGLINGVERVGPPLQPQKGTFDATILESLDFLLFEMGKRNMKAIVFLSNNWEWSGGFLQYLNWNGQIADSVLKRKLAWEEMRDYISKFYSCEPCKEDYNKQLAYVLNHTNTYSGKKYIDEPAIMAWELANEPRPMRPAADTAYKQWIHNVAVLIKANDKNHLVTTGHEGEIGTESLSFFEDVHRDKNIDYLTIHIWPKNWGWFKDTAIAKDLQNVISTTESYINRHIAVAEKLQKPLVLEEFGLPRNLL